MDDDDDDDDDNDDDSDDDDSDDCAYSLSSLPDSPGYIELRAVRRFGTTSATSDSLVEADFSQDAPEAAEEMEALDLFALFAMRLKSRQHLQPLSFEQLHADVPYVMASTDIDRLVPALAAQLDRTHRAEPALQNEVAEQTRRNNDEYCIQEDIRSFELHARETFNKANNLFGLLCKFDTSFGDSWPNHAFLQNGNVLEYFAEERAVKDIIQSATETVPASNGFDDDLKELLSADTGGPPLPLRALESILLPVSCQIVREGLVDVYNCAKQALEMSRRIRDNLHTLQAARRSCSVVGLGGIIVADAFKFVAEHLDLTSACSLAVCINGMVAREPSRKAEVENALNLLGMHIPRLHIHLTPTPALMAEANDERAEVSVQTVNGFPHVRHPDGNGDVFVDRRLRVPISLVTKHPREGRRLKHESVLPAFAACDISPPPEGASRRRAKNYGWTAINVETDPEHVLKSVDPLNYFKEPPKVFIELLLDTTGKPVVPDDYDQNWPIRGGLAPDESLKKALYRERRILMCPPNGDAQRQRWAVQSNIEKQRRITEMQESVNKGKKIVTCYYAPPPFPHNKNCHALFLSLSADRNRVHKFAALQRKPWHPESELFGLTSYNYNDHKFKIRVTLKGTVKNLYGTEREWIVRDETPAFEFFSDERSCVSSRKRKLSASQAMVVVEGVD